MCWMAASSFSLLSDWTQCQARRFGVLGVELRQVRVRLSGMQSVLPWTGVLSRKGRYATPLAAPSSIGRPKRSEKPVESAHDYLNARAGSADRLLNP